MEGEEESEVEGKKKDKVHGKRREERWKKGMR